MHPVSWTNTHPDVTYFLHHGMVKNTKTWISGERNINFLQNKKMLNQCLRWHILRSYCFVADAILYFAESISQNRSSRLECFVKRFPKNFHSIFKTSFLQNNCEEQLLRKIQENVSRSVARTYANISDSERCNNN